MHLMEDIRLMNDVTYHEGCVCLNNIMHLLAGYTKVYDMVDKCHDHCRQQHKGRMLQLEKYSPRLRRLTARQTNTKSLKEKLMEKLQMRATM